MFYATGLLSDLTLRGFTLDGDDFEDTDNNYPMVYIDYAEDLLLENLYVRDSSVGLRVGVSPNTSRRVRVRDCRVDNMFEHGIELFRCYDSEVSGNVLTAGTNSGDGPDGANGCRAIRLFGGCRRCDVVRNHVLSNGADAWGVGVGINTDTLNYNAEINVAWNTIVGANSPGYGAIYSYFGLRNSTIAFNKIIGGSGGTPKLIHIGTDVSSDSADLCYELTIANNLLEAGDAETHLIHVKQVNGFDIRANTLKHLLSEASEHFAVQIGDSNGFGVVQANRFNMNGTGAVGVEDFDGQASSKIAVMDSVTVFAGGTFVQQDSSAGTLTEQNTLAM